MQTLAFHRQSVTRMAIIINCIIAYYYIMSLHNVIIFLSFNTPNKGCSPIACLPTLCAFVLFIIILAAADVCKKIIITGNHV